jgi:hypothetical protein
MFKQTACYSIFNIFNKILNQKFPSYEKDPQ